jgi:hypothetical protein
MQKAMLLVVTLVCFGCSGEDIDTAEVVVVNEAQDAGNDAAPVACQFKDETLCDAGVP